VLHLECRADHPGWGARATLRLNAGHAADRDVIRLYLLQFVAQLDGSSPGPR
jgi:hypothetical protein